MKNFTAIYKQSAFQSAFILMAALLFFAANSAFSQTNKNNTLTKKEKKEGWVLLFDGKTTAGWSVFGTGRFPDEVWSVEDGCLVTKDKPEHTKDIVTDKEYSNFELFADYKVEPGVNTGIKYFFTTYAKGGNLGMEYQMLDEKLAADNKLANHLTGSLYDIFPADSTHKKLNPAGQWNTVHIICKNKHVEHWLNGVKMVEFEIGSDAYLAAVGKSKYKTEPVFGTVEKGRILLQDHDGKVSFRNIKIRVLRGSFCRGV